MTTRPSDTTTMTLPPVMVGGGAITMTIAGGRLMVSLQPAQTTGNRQETVKVEEEDER